MKNKLITILMITTLALLSFGGNISSINAQEEPLIIGMEAAYPPYNWTQSDDANNGVPIIDSSDFANGYDVQIARRIGEALGREVQVMKIEWEGIIPALMADKVDLIIAGMSPTEERAQVIDFSDPYYDIQFAIVTMKDSAFAQANSLEELAGARVTGQLGTLHYDLITQIPDVQQAEAMKSFPIMRVALEADRIDAYVSEIPEAESAVSANDQLSFFIPDPSFEVADADKQLAIGVKKGNTELLDAVNATLADITEEERNSYLQEAIENQPANVE